MKLLLLIKSIIIMYKLYYSISEVCQLVDEEQHILRYWEKEFPQLRPKKNRGGNRIYSKKDIALIGSIKKLLRQDKIPLESAKKKISTRTAKELPVELFVAKLPEKTLPVGAKSKTKISDDIEKFSLSHDEAMELLNILRKFSNLLNKN